MRRLVLALVGLALAAEAAYVIARVYRDPDPQEDR